MWTRREYMDNGIGLYFYYGQFITPAIREYVISQIGQDRIECSLDQYFNDIPLEEWDRLESAIQQLVNRNIFEKAGETWSQCTSVCIAKAAADRWRNSRK